MPRVFKSDGTEKLSTSSGTNVQVNTGGNLTGADFQDTATITWSEAGGVVTATASAADTETLVISCRKGSVGTITIGSPVYISGYNVGGWIEVEEAEADVSASMPAIAVASQSITNAATVTAVVNGQVSGIDTSTFAINDALYVSETAGLLTDVRPTGASSGIQSVARVTRSHASGIIEVIGAGRTNDVPNLTDDYFWLGNGSNVATEVQMSSDATMDNAGAVTIEPDAVTYDKMQDVSAADRLLGRSTAGAGTVEEITVGGDISQSGSTFTIGDAAVSYAKIQNVVNDDRFLGRISGAGGDIEELTGTQATTLLDVFTSGLQGVAPASGGGTTNFLRADGTWAAPPAGGSPPTGTGFRHITGGAEDGASELVNFADADHILANQGTANQVLHGNAAGLPSFSAVAAADLAATTGSGTDVVLAAGPTISDVDLTGVTDVQDSFNLSDVISATLTGDVDDWAPTGIATASLIRVTASGTTRTINSIAASQVGGRVLRIVSLDAVYDVRIANEAGSGTAANKILTGSGTILLETNESVDLMYDGTSSRWRVVGRNTGLINLSNAIAAEVKNTLAETNGGTGENAYTTGDMLYASGSNNLSRRGIGTNNEVLRVSGSVPFWEEELLSKDGSLANPTAAENRYMFYTPVAITITQLRVVVQGTSPSLTMVFYHDTTRAGTTNTLSGSAAYTNTTGGTVATLSDATIPSGSFVHFETSAESNCDEVGIHVRYTVD